MYTQIAYELFPGLVELTLTCAKKKLHSAVWYLLQCSTLRGSVLCSAVRHSGLHSGLD